MALLVLASVMTIKFLSSIRRVLYRSKKGFSKPVSKPACWQPVLHVFFREYTCIKQKGLSHPPKAPRTWSGAATFLHCSLFFSLFPRGLRRRKTTEFGKSGWSKIPITIFKRHVHTSNYLQVLDAHQATVTPLLWKRVRTAALL